LGRSVDAFTRGDAGAARHLGYYAELRAAMSLLAAEGIGIFSNKHFVVEDIRTCALLPRSANNQYQRTHSIAWLALEYWSTQRASGEVVSNIIGAHNASLREWMVAFGAGLNIPTIASSWLRQWGLDLKKLSMDRDARNDSSYRPSVQGYPQSISAVGISENLRSLWKMFTPDGNTRYLSVDRYLIRLSLQRAFKSITGNSPELAPQQFQARIKRMLASLGIHGAIGNSWLEFLLNRTEPLDPVFLTNASGSADPRDSFQHLHVLARAGLLLRIATGACAIRLSNAGVEKDALSFWWRPIGNDRGLWATNGEPEQLVDLWADAMDALSFLEQWEDDANTGRNDGSLADLLRAQSNALTTLAQCERIGFWGLGL
jgi:hypothetical protein